MIRLIALFFVLALSMPAAFAESQRPANATTVKQPAGSNAGATATAAAAPAPTPATPAKMSREDMLDIELCDHKFAEMDRASAELRAHRDEVLKRYGIKLEDVGKSVAIMADGTIKRAEPPAPAPKLAKKK